MADVDPATVGYVEAHGTGTLVGDPIEVRALTKAFGAARARTGRVLLGSLKPNIGHTDAAAGVLGLIKAILALEHELIPARCTSAPRTRRSTWPPARSGSSAAPAWPRGDRPRRAGVNSLGLGGTNAHVVLEEAPPSRAGAGANRPGRTSCCRCRPALPPRSAALASNLAGHALQAAGRRPLADVAWTLQAGRHAFRHRGFVVACDARTRRGR